MAKTAIATIKNWFRDGVKPAQEHFWNWMDSFWHKDELIPIDSVDGLQTELENISVDTSSLALRDASNLSPENVADWQTALAMSALGSVDDQVKLSKPYPGLEIEPEEFQVDFNTAAESKLIAIDETLATKMSPPGPAGTYIVQANGDGTFQWIPAGTVYRFMGSIPTYADRPSDPQQGDVYNVVAADPGNNILAGDNIAWTGTEWDNLGGIIDASQFVARWEFDDLLEIALTTEEQTLTPEQQAQVRENIGVTSGGGGSSEWGEITGTLADQADLQSALDSKSNVGHTHDYGDLDNLPPIPEDVSDLTDTTNLLFSGDYVDLENKPTIPAQVNLIPGPNIDITGTYPNLTIEAAGGGGGSSAWGTITGNIGDQTDLQSALNAKANDADVVKTSGNQTVAGVKTFSTSPVVPSKSTAAANAPTTIATEAQVFLKANDADVVKTSGSQTIAGVKTFSTSPVVPSKSTAAANTPTAIATEAQVFLKANDADVVKTSGNQTVAGVKTFSSFPVTPSSAPTTDYQVANRKYVNDKVAEAGGGTTYTPGVGIDIVSNVISQSFATDSEIGGVKVWKGTKAAYVALGTYDSNTFYFIEDTETAEIAVFTIDTAYTISSDASFFLSLASAISPEVWAKCYDWDITWRDAGGLHNLRDFQYAVLNQIYLVGRNGSGDFEMSVDWRAGSVVIPVGAKLTLHLSNDAPIYST